MQKTKQIRKSIARAPRCGVKRNHNRCDRAAIQTLPRLTPEQIATALGDVKETPRCLQANPGEGYRLLQPGEIIQEGDDICMGSLRWERRVVNIGEAQKPNWAATRRKEAKPFFGQFLIVSREGVKTSVNTHQELQSALWGKDMAQHDVWVRMDSLPLDVGSAALRAAVVQAVSEQMADPRNQGVILIEN
jgi:hypothetical protein